MPKKKKKVKPTKEGGLKHFLVSPQFAVTRGAFYMLLAVFAFVAIVSYTLSYIVGGVEPLRTTNWHSLYGALFPAFRLWTSTDIEEQGA